MTRPVTIARDPVTGELVQRIARRYLTVCIQIALGNPLHWRIGRG